ncbi:MAG: hypothetical protein ACNA7J_09900 [Wenzhouxiangella sp.]
MDTAVSLVNAYLQINGFLTVTEYPLLERAPVGRTRTVTDLDVLGFRFPHAGRELSMGKGKSMAGDVRFEPDPALGGSANLPDMIVGEVKRGQARFNPATRHPGALAAALMRFGCCPGPEARELAERLVRQGQAETAGGHEIRMIAFGGIEPDQQPRGWRIISLGHVMDYLQTYLREEWPRLRHVTFSNPILDLFALIQRTESQSGRRREVK